MAYVVEFLPSAARSLASLPKDVQNRLARRIDALGETPRPPGVTVLQGGEGFLRLRVGDYRVIYQIKTDRLIVVIVRVGHRKDVYRRR